MSLSKDLNKNRIKIQIKNLEDLMKINETFFINTMKLIEKYPTPGSINLIEFKLQFQILVNLMKKEYEKATFSWFLNLITSHKVFINKLNEVFWLDLFSNEIIKNAILVYTKKWTQLSKLIWKNWDEISNDVIRQVINWVSKWYSSEFLWKSLKQYLQTPDKWANYKLWRVGRTELARVHSEITKNTVIDFNKNKENDYEILLKYNLGNAKEHGTEDEKNANRDIWYGKGIYTPKTAPSIPVHPNCLCYFTNILIDKKTKKQITL